MQPVTLEVLLEKKHPDMAAFVVVPASAVAAWGLSATTTVEGSLDGIPLGRRSLHRWDADGMPVCASVRPPAIEWSA
jgi:hypothetical protein